MLGWIKLEALSDNTQPKRGREDIGQNLRISGKKVLLAYQNRLHAYSRCVNFSVGMTEITVEIANPQDRARWRSLKVIADTGAIFSVLPRATLEGLGIAPYAEETFHLADGREIHGQLGDVFLRINGKERTVPAIFGEPADTPLLGVTALEILGFTVDPRSQKLEPTKMLLL